MDVNGPCPQGSTGDGEGKEPEAAPVTATMTIAYTLPGGVEVAAPEPFTVAREAGPAGRAQISAVR